MLSDLINTSGFSSEKSVQNIGQVGDKEIDRVEFAQNVENFVQQRQGQMSTMQAVKQVWDAKVQDLLLKKNLKL